MVSLICAISFKIQNKLSWCPSKANFLHSFPLYFILLLKSDPQYNFQRPNVQYIVAYNTLPSTI